MGFAVFDRVSGEVELGEEGIGGDGSYFFWVWQVLLWWPMTLMM